MAHLAEATPDAWVWLQHQDLTEPSDVINLRNDLLTAAFARGHGTAAGPGPRTYALVIGDDIKTGGVTGWFFARPEVDHDGDARYWIESVTERIVTHSPHAHNAQEVRDAFAEFLDWL
jgi:hypothetical protein